MKKNKLFFLVFILVFLLYSSSLAVYKDILIYFANDTHAKYLIPSDSTFQAEKFATFMKETKRQMPNGTLFIHGGDAFDWFDMVTIASQGEDVAQLMNNEEWDLMVLGNNEFDYGLKNIREKLPYFGFPILSANASIKDQSRLLALPYYIKEIEGAKIGFIGLTTAGAASYDTNLTLEDPIQTASKYVGILKPFVDVIICINHLGISKDSVLAQKVSGIDLILGGHSHTFMQTPVKVNQTWIIHTQGGCKDIASVILKLDTMTNKLKELELNRIVAKYVNQKYPPDEQASALLESFDTVMPNFRKAQAFMNQGMEPYEKKKFSEARVLFEKARYLLEDNFFIQLNIADTYFDEKDFKNAASEYEKTEKLPRDEAFKMYFPYLYLNLGKSYDVLGKREKALEQYNKALQLQPQSKEAKKYLEEPFKAEETKK